MEWAGKAAVRLYHTIGGLLLLWLVAVVSFQAGDRHWPYRVAFLEIQPDPVRPGGVLTIQRDLEFDRTDCDLRFNRTMESVAHPGPPLALPEEVRVDLEGAKRLTDPLRLLVPAGFACGAAQVRSRPTAACNWTQYIFRLRASEAVVPFDVECRTPP